MVAKRTVGFALGGGGARGSFSAGALDYLIREAGLIPKVITGTSAGSICASVLAQARTSEEFHTAATVLRDDVIRLGVPGVAFEPQPWLTGLEGTPLAVDVRELMAGTMRPTIPPIRRWPRTSSQTRLQVRGLPRSSTGSKLPVQSSLVSR